MDQQRIRIHADVYFLEVAGGAVIRNRNGALELSGAGVYQLLAWIFKSFDGSRSYADTVKAIPAALEKHARAIVTRLVERSFARVLDEQQETVVAPFRARFPELNNMLEYRTASPAQAWQRIDAARLVIDADGQFGAALREALPQYGLQVAAGAGALRIVAAGTPESWTGLAAMGAAPEAALCRHGDALFVLVPGERPALPGTPDFPALVTRYASAAAPTGLHAPAALAIAVHALCLALFERVALGQARNQDRLLTVDDATLTLGSHALTPYAVPRRDWQPPGTPLSAAQCGAGLRPDLGGSLLPDAGVAELNAIARSVQALTDERTGPLARADDGDLFQLPLASCLAAGAGSRVLMLGLSARETRNHAALWALEQRLAHNGPAHAGAAGIGWSRCEALLRAGRRLFEHGARAPHTDPQARALADVPASAELAYLAELHDDGAQARWVRNDCGWFVASHPAMPSGAPVAPFGVGILPELALADLFIKLAFVRYYDSAAFDAGAAVLVRLGLDDAALERALAAAMAGCEAAELALPWLPEAPAVRQPVTVVLRRAAGPR